MGSTTIHAFVRYVQASARSRLAWLLACLHAAWFLLSIANMSAPSTGFAAFLDSGGGSSATIFAGRPFHFAYESIALKLLLLLDLPSELAVAVVGLLSIPIALPFEKMFHPTLYARSYFGASLVFLVATCQWLAVGNSLETWLASKKHGTRVVATFRSYFIAAVVLILSCTIVFVPIVNKRSRALGFRHPAISFGPR